MIVIDASYCDVLKRFLSNQIHVDAIFSFPCQIKDTFLYGSVLLPNDVS